MSNILYYPVDQSGITTENWGNYTDMNNMTNIYSNVEYNIEQTKQDNDNLITLKNNLLKLLNEDNDELIKEEIEKELKEKFLNDIESKTNNDVIDNVTDVKIVDNLNDDNNVVKIKQNKDVLKEFNNAYEDLKKSFHKIQNEFIEIDNTLITECKKTTEQIKNLENMINFTSKLDKNYKEDKIMEEIIERINLLATKIENNNDLENAKKEYIKKRIEINKYLDMIKSLNNLNISNICPLCLTNKIEVYINPCGHCSCTACKDRLLQYEGSCNDAKCFICRKNIEKFNTIFLS
jgi:hypothetical protein